MTSGLVALVKAELTKLPLDRTIIYKHDDPWIRCPIHNGGNETTQSFKINLAQPDKAAIGHAYCFGCKQSMPWNNFAALYNLKPFSKGMVRESAASIYGEVQKDNPIPPDYKLYSKWPDTLAWRTIPGKTVKKFKGRAVKFGRETRLYLPITVYGENMGGIYCALNKTEANAGKTYINTDGDWAQHSLIGFDVARKMSGPLWVVEGPRDTGWVSANGVRVNGLIGSAVTETKLKLMEDLDPPSILIATDPDEAGTIAADKIASFFHNRIPCKRLPMKSDEKTGKKLEDPTDLSPKRIQRANQKMIELFGAG